MKRCIIFIGMVIAMLTTIAIAEDISDTLPSSDIWEISQKQMLSQSSISLEKCIVGNANGLMANNIIIDDYDFNVYYVFSEDMGDFYGLSKISYILSDSSFMDTTALKKCYNTMIANMKKVAGIPESETESVTKWNMDDYIIQIGTGRFKNYIGSDDLTLGIIFKYTASDFSYNPTVSSSQSVNDSIPMQTLQTDHFTISVPSNWSLQIEDSGYYYYDDNREAMLCVQEYGPIDYLQYMNNEGIHRIMKDTVASKFKIEYSSELNYNGLSVMFFNICDDNYSRYLLASNTGEYIIYALYIEENGNDEIAYNTAIQFFKTIQETNSNSNISSATPESVGNETEDYSRNETSEFSGTMITVDIAGKSVQIHQSFKDLMDSYEAFFSNYIDAMSSGDYIQMLNALTNYAEMIEALEDLDDADLTEGEAAYYIEVYTRIMQKLALYDY